MRDIVVRQEVKDFAKAMEYKLMCNDSKRHWENASREDCGWFLECLKEEVRELEEALEIGSVRDVVLEAADVGNFAMMIMNVFARGQEGEVPDPDKEEED
ncbi:hypothetical protein [Candidatus Darwinibacter acetoxidans]